MNAHKTETTDLLTWEFKYCFLIVALYLSPNLYLFTSKMQSYKRAIGEVSVTVANAHSPCMSVSVLSYMLVYLF